MECVLRKMGIADTEFVDPAIARGAHRRRARAPLPGQQLRGRRDHRQRDPQGGGAHRDRVGDELVRRHPLPVPGRRGALHGQAQVPQHARQPAHLRERRRARLRDALQLHPALHQRHRDHGLRGQRDLDVEQRHVGRSVHGQHRRPGSSRAGRRSPTGSTRPRCTAGRTARSRSTSSATTSRLPSRRRRSGSTRPTRRAAAWRTWTSTTRSTRRSPPAAPRARAGASSSATSTSRTRRTTRPGASCSRPSAPPAR